MNRHIDPGAFSVWDDRLEAQFSKHLATIPTPVAPRTSPYDPERDAVIDVTPETLGDRAVVAHINTWKANRDRNATPRDLPDDAA